MIIDKNCIQQVLGGLIKRPSYLSEIDKYSLDVSDFSSYFERAIFIAISGLYNSGASHIGPVDIENYLRTDKTAITRFQEEGGIEYLNDIEDFCSPENFQYYYDKLKKINLLNDLKKQGINTEEFYCEELLSSQAEKINKHFESLTTKDIIDSVRKKLVSLESSYVSTDEVKTWELKDEIDELIDGLGKTIEVGLPIQGKIFNKVIDGAQKGALTICSGSSGLGKTRIAVANACYLAFPLRYNPIMEEWEQEGSCEKVLFIITEQTHIQIEKMILAYLTGINESKFKYGIFSQDELIIINQARKLIKEYSSNFILVRIPNPTIELMKTKIREEAIIHNVGYVFYDYVFISPAALGEFKGFSLRNDEILLMMVNALKNLAVELNVCVFTATQVNASADDSSKIRNEASLAGGRSQINKADNGCIMARPTAEDLQTLQSIISTYGIPNMVTDIFKVRSGEWTQVRIWSIVDLGIMRREDLFITDASMNPIEGFFDNDYYVPKYWEEKDEKAISEKIKQLNQEIGRVERKVRFSGL